MDAELTMLDGKIYFTVLYCGDEIVFETEEEARHFIEEIEREERQLDYRCN